MAMLVIDTQYYENYGAHDWNGEGECPQYWKAKGGSSYKILNCPLNIDFEEVVAASGIGHSNDYSEEVVIGWAIESDDYLSWFEKSQLEYDGAITCFEPTLEYSEIVERSMA